MPCKVNSTAQSHKRFALGPLKATRFFFLSDAGDSFCKRAASGKVPCFAINVRFGNSHGYLSHPITETQGPALLNGGGFKFYPAVAKAQLLTPCAHQQQQTGPQLVLSNLFRGAIWLHLESGSSSVVLVKGFSCYLAYICIFSLNVGRISKVRGCLSKYVLQPVGSMIWERPCQLQAETRIQTQNLTQCMPCMPFLNSLR